MKIKNLIVLSSLVFLGTLFSGFVSPRTEIIIEDKGGESFAEFLSHFEKTELPYRFALDDFKQYEVHKKGISKAAYKKTQKKFSKSRMRKGGVESPISRMKYIPEVARGRFGRMGPPEVHPVARFYPNKKMVAIVYSSKRRFSKDLNTNYNLVVYDLKGKVLFPSKANQKDFRYAFNLGFSSLENTVAFEIDKEGRIWKNTYDNVWKKNIKKSSFLDNQLVDFKIMDTEVFELNEKGVAVQLKDIPAEARASLN